jgi:DNA/RNA-binding domain of Phe-tRNA-synthetase-like protein
MEANSSWNGKILIRKEVLDIFPDIVVAHLNGHIRNSLTHPLLWKRLLERQEEISGSMDEASIRLVNGIASGKRAYRQLGKDPNRYRLSAEALMRRVVKGKGLYSISNAVDALNLVSLRSGITIGGFDASLVTGAVELGIGLPDEEFTAIGRGILNIDRLPVYRDQRGAIGSPTSDSERTQISLETTEILMVITGFYGMEEIQSVMEDLKSLLMEFCNCPDCQTGIITNFL